MGTVSDRWSVYHSEKESQNRTSLQDYLIKGGFTPVLKTVNSQSELLGKWKDHCQQHCIEQTTTEPHFLWENTIDPNIVQLISTVRNVKNAFGVPLKEYNWAQKWCVDVHNIDSSKNLNGGFPLEMSERDTQDISKFRFH